MQGDVSAPVNPASEAHSQRSPDSGLSLRPGTEGSALSASSGGDTRAGSRSSTLSSSDDSVKVKPMGDSMRPASASLPASQQPPQQPQLPPGSGPPGAGQLVRPSPTAAGMPPQPPPTSASTAAVAVAQHYAQLSQHYHAAAAMQALGAANPIAAQQAAAATQILAAQYQQSLASMTPDMLLKQFPHLSTASLNAPPHLLGRAPGNAEHLHLLQARERELAAERERQQRERYVKTTTTLLRLGELGREKLIFCVYLLLPVVHVRIPLSRYILTLLPALLVPGGRRQLSI